VFFVLSGFVISHVVSTRENTLAPYAAGRIARIFSVAVPALFATFVLDWIGREIRPEIYAELLGYSTHQIAWQFVSGLFFLNQTWWNTIEIGSNGPWWSLGYEVPFYVLFAILAFSRGGVKVALAVIVAVVAGPKILVTFPLWLLGYGLYRLMRRTSIRASLGVAIWVLSIVAFALVKRSQGEQGALFLPFTFTAERMGDYGYHYLVALLFSANLLGFAAFSERLSAPLQALSRPIRWLGGTTFTLYLFHYPILMILLAITPWQPEAWQNRIVMFAVPLLLVAAAAQVTERQKFAWRRVIERLTLPRTLRGQDESDKA
jgi:peptidoglycan/LPS O-acetylase OafA/YrhL